MLQIKTLQCMQAYYHYKNITYMNNCYPVSEYELYIVVAVLALVAILSLHVAIIYLFKYM